MTAPSETDPAAVLELSPAERAERGLDAEAVTEALVATVEAGGADARTVEGVELPELDLRYRELSGANTRPLVFRDCDLGGLALDGADVRLPLRFENCTVGGLSAAEAHFERDVVADGCRFAGPVDLFEARFDRDAVFGGATFEAGVEIEEAEMNGEADFGGATFEAPVSMRGTAFAGRSNELSDNASFVDARFEGEAAFRQAAFGALDASGATFADDAGFQELRCGDDALFEGVTFEGLADFDEADFEQDVSFEGARFREAHFRGAEFEGGARTLHDDADFAGVTFERPADFTAAAFRYADFEGVTFEAGAVFREVEFGGDADFAGAAFEAGDREAAGTTAPRGEDGAMTEATDESGGEAESGSAPGPRSGEAATAPGAGIEGGAEAADFDEARFEEDADFSSVRFGGVATFRGAEFEGEANHVEENALFADARFGAAAAFTNARFTSVSFDGTRLDGEGDLDARGAVCDELVLAPAVGEEGYVDCTGAVIREGRIVQPAQGRVRYDLTVASLGDVAIEAQREADRGRVLDYVRFCRTEFNEFDGYDFDFAAHTEYFDRNDWTLHAFEDPADRTYAREMTPANVEATYLKAKTAASAAGQMKAAGEFRIKRQRQARRKHLGIARDPGADRVTRLKNASRAVENYFLDITCGHGIRLVRIVGVFLAAPFLFGLAYAFGGQPFRTGAGQVAVSELSTAAGLATLYENLYFSYISFLTIGYGNIGPKGALARMAAATEVYLSVILGGLVVYALVKRSEI